MFSNRVTRQGQELTGSESLAFFRIVFGLLLLVAECRFIARGWVSDFYIKPRFFFPFYGFEWLKPLPEHYMYGVFYGLIFLSFCITLGLFYRPAIVIFFLLFTYVELLDKSVYLNHYYQVSMVSLLMCFLPMNGTCALDNYIFPKSAKSKVPYWMLWSLRLQVGMVYFFGGIAKLRADWLFEAQPLRIWLSANTDFPLIGPFLDLPWVAFALSWFAMVFDLSAPFLLSRGKTRIYMYIIVVLFHVMTHFLFFIGMFPWMMIFTALIFFPPAFHRRIIRLLRGRNIAPTYAIQCGKRSYDAITTFLTVFFFFQLLMPFRSHLYQGNVLWHEQGFRFSWNIMLMEKNASLEYEVIVKRTGRKFTVKPNQFLSRIQARQCSFQPDMILQFAHILHDHYLRSGIGDTEIRANCYASVNGHGSELLIDPNTDLVLEEDNFAPKEWITKWRH